MASITLYLRETGISPKVNIFTDRTKAVYTSFVDHLCYLFLVFVMLLRLFIAALWSPAGKELTCSLWFVMFNCVSVTFPCGIPGQLWYLIVWIPDLYRLSYFYFLVTENVVFGDRKRNFDKIRTFMVAANRV